MKRIFIDSLAYPLAYPLLLFTLWAVAEIIANPTGQFPLNDDWAYARTVHYLVNEGQIKFVNWYSMTLLAQVFWSSLFCYIFGFSFMVLRISAIILGIISILTFYKILDHICDDKRLAFCASLLFAFNPIYFSLTNTFMTDVPFMCFALLSFYFYLKGLDTGNIKYILIGTCFAIITTFIRQLGVILPVCFALVHIIKNKITLKNIFFSLISPIIVCLMLFLFNQYYGAANKLPDAYGKIGLLFDFFSDFNKLFKEIVMRTGFMSLYLGFFLLPLLLIIFPKQICFSKWLWIVLAIFLFPIIYIWENIPFGNIIYNFGIGPKTLKDTYILGINSTFKISRYTWNLLKITGLIGAIGYLLLFFNLPEQVMKLNLKKKIANINNAKLLSCLFVALYFAFFTLWSSYLTDRYLIPFIPFFIIMIMPNEKISIRYPVILASLVLFIANIVFAISGTHDYFSWNRARWKAVDYLLNEKKITPDHIDGGFEFNGWYGDNFSKVSGCDKSWWFVKDDTYLISFGNIAGYRKIAQFSYSQWIGRGNAQILVLKR